MDERPEEHIVRRTLCQNRRAKRKIRRCMGVHLIDVHFIGIHHLMSVHLMGVYLISEHLMDYVHLVHVHIMGVDVRKFRFWDF